MSAFDVDPAVMSRIRPMQYTDASVVAGMHHAAMGNSLWSKLGVAFLTEIYRGLVEDERFLGFVYVEDNVIRGFIAGSTDASEMMSAVMNKRFVPLALTATAGVAKRPGVIPLLLKTATYFSESDGDFPIPAESLFCSFAPELRGKRVSGHINKVLFDDLAARGHGHVKITTEIDNPGANRQLKSWGFEDAKRFRFYGKDMITYVLDLKASPRVEPRLSHPTV
ncbi:MAG: hypothetical protein GY913_06255 [Proteobacteria bacterium]|nr:hypothetical protein [Pseudomonadota bacterium]MCP4916509.1 hypothetical protein [Pseudomonadota bacterium]